MKFFWKLKMEIIALILIVLGVIAFFIYGKVREVQSIDFIESQTVMTQDSLAVSREITTVLKEIRDELSLSNCLNRAGSNEAQKDLCE